MEKYFYSLLLLLVIGSLATLVPDQRLDHWTYIKVSNSHSSGFGLDFGDLTGDGKSDIISCSHFYKNPGSDMSGTWTQVSLPANVDACLVIDVDEDALGDAIATKSGEQYWLEADDSQASSWTATKIGNVIDISNHGVGTQGYLLAQIEAGGKEEIIFTESTSTNGAVYYFKIPSNPAAGNWTYVKLSDRSNGESVGAADFDNDNDVDVCGAASRGDSIVWWENPGDGSAYWISHKVGTTFGRRGERISTADINGDQKPDIVVTEENNGTLDNCHIMWFQCPSNAKTGTWIRHDIAVQNGTFGMSVADMDNDGDMDIVTGENIRGTEDGTEETVVWENRNSGANWVKHVVDTGKESHHGSRAVDLDGDGDMDIVSIGYDTYRELHLWRNDAEPTGMSLIRRPLSVARGLVNERGTETLNVFTVFGTRGDLLDKDFGNRNTLVKKGFLHGTVVIMLR